MNNTVAKTYFFISDIHLGLQTPVEEKAKEKQLVDFINYASQNCDELFIVGDLFDYWFEYKRVMQKGFIRTLSALTRFADTGKKIHYVIGNHDFLHKNFFTNEVGALVYQDSIDTILNGKKFYLAHGDGLVKKDIGYNILKKILRNKVFQKMYTWLHPDIGIKIASHSSKTSRDYTKKKNYGELDGMFDAAKAKIELGYDYVIFGHSHSRTFENYKEGNYINLGTWLDKPCYGKFTNQFEIIDWN